MLTPPEITSIMPESAQKKLTGISCLITHPGSAHRDDLLACALLLALAPRIPLFRRTPSAKELDDPSVIVVDVGARHEPAKFNFDHHQLREASPVCAFTLVLRFLGMEADFRVAHSWLGWIEACDCLGPMAAASRFGVPPEAMALFSPIDRYWVEKFSKVKQLLPADSLHRSLRGLGDQLLAQTVEIWQRLSQLADHGRRRWLGPVFFIDLTDLDGESGSFAGVAAYRERLPTEEQARMAGVITISRRDGSRQFTRCEDHPAVDFRNIAERPGVTFVHATGFTACLALSADEALNVAARAINIAWRP